MSISNAATSPFSGLAPSVPPQGRVVSGKTAAQRPGAIATAASAPRVVSGATMAARQNGDVPATGSMVSGTDPSRFGGHGATSATPFPVYGQANTGQMPDIQRAFAKGKENSGITQLLPNLPQQNAPGVPQLVTPQLSRVTGGESSGFTPGEVLNIQRESENQTQQTADARRQQALNATNGALGNVNGLYQQAAQETRALGNQQYGRIDQAEKNNISQAQGNLISRGLGNSTITNTVNDLYQRQANDARLGVDESKAKLNLGLDTQLADKYQQAGTQTAGLLTGGTPTDPSDQTLGSFGQAKANNNIAGQLLGQVGGTLLGGAAGGAGSALGAGAGAGMGSILSMIAGLF